ncbi:MAG: iron ABC transporter permease [bacterium]|nr:iron ABC transporter permease [bacterium]
MNRYIIIAIFVLLALVAFAAGLLVGPGVSVSDSARALFSGGNPIITYRLVRVLSAIIVGVALSSAGCALQALLKNPLAEPYLLGMSSGAGFGAALATILGLSVSVFGFSALNLFAFGGGMLAVTITFMVARGSGLLSVHALLLAGVMVGAAFGSLVLLMLAIFPARDQHQLFLWLMGDLGSPDITLYRIIITGGIVAVGYVLVVVTSRVLDVLALGDEAAFNVGVPIEKMKVFYLIIAALVTGASVALAGPIGFVGILVPHAVRRLVGPHHLTLLIGSAFAGSFLLLFGDLLVRTASGYFDLPIIPVGVFTALLGAPYFLFLLKRKGGGVSG